MKRDAFDILLQRVTFGVTLVRILRGEDPKQVERDVQEMNERAERLRKAIDHHVDGAPAPSAEPKREGN